MNNVRLVDYSDSDEDDCAPRVAFHSNPLPPLPTHIDNSPSSSSITPPSDNPPLPNPTTSSIPQLQSGEGHKKSIHFKEVSCTRQFKNTIYCRRLIPESDTPILDDIINAALTEIKRDFLLLVEEHHGIKGWVAVRNLYHSVKTQEEFENTLQSRNYIMTNDFETDEILHQMKDQLISRNSELTRGRSDLQLIRTLDLTIKVVRWAPIRAGYFVKLPTFLQNKHSIINVKSTDNRCFGYALASYFLYQESHDKLGADMGVPM